LGNIAIIFWAFIGVFCSITLIEVIGHQVPSFRDHGAPAIVGSFGAAAVLEFYAIESPLAQPRNAILGQILSSIVGISICKLFALSSSFQSLRWLAASISCASAVALMALTGTVHPPAGATALMAVADDNIVRLGWHLIPVMLLGCALMQCIALLINNIQRRFPVYWWTPEEVGRYWHKDDDEKGSTTEGASTFTLASVDIDTSLSHDEGRKVVITKGTVVIPASMYLRPEEKLLLESLGQRL